MDVCTRFEMVRGSDVSRQGMFLELWDRPANELALWAFHCDADGTFEFTRYRWDVPKTVEDWFHWEARRLLPPITTDPGPPAGQATK